MAKASDQDSGYCTLRKLRTPFRLFRIFQPSFRFFRSSLQFFQPPPRLFRSPPRLSRSDVDHTNNFRTFLSSKPISDLIIPENKRHSQRWQPLSTWKWMHLNFALYFSFDQNSDWRNFVISFVIFAFHSVFIEYSVIELVKFCFWITETHVKVENDASFVFLGIPLSV